MEHKCSDCLLVFTGSFDELREYFYANIDSADGLKSICKKCSSIRGKAYRSIKYEKDPIIYTLKECLRSALKRSIRKNMEYSIDLSWGLLQLDEIDMHCPVCQKLFDFSVNHNKHDCISLDRFDNSKGYTQSNTVIICGECNWFKADRSIEQLEIFANQIILWIKKRAKKK